MKFNAVNNKESGCVLSVSGQCVKAQARSALLASSRCELYNVSWRPLSSFGLCIILFILLPPSLLPFYFSSDKSVWQVPGPICVGAHGWKARVYHGLAVYAEEMRGKTRGEWDEFPPFSLSSLSRFFISLSIFWPRSTIWTTGTGEPVAGLAKIGSPWTNDAPISTKRRSCEREVKYFLTPSKANSIPAL